MAKSDSATSTPAHHSVHCLGLVGEHGRWRRTVYADSTNGEPRLVMTTDAPCMAS